MPTKKKKVLPVDASLLDMAKPEENSNEDIKFPIVGIGASAGGLETLSDFFSIMPPDCNFAFVVIQHLSPNYKSIMASLVDKHTQMNVVQIEDGVQVEANHVYLNPPGMNVAMFNGCLHLMAPVKSKSINMPIDFFFRSLAEDQHEKAIGIILSGTASDGALGIRAIKGNSGMVMVQKPETAKYDGMPKSAIQTGLVDFILPVEKMPETLARYAKHPIIESLDKFQLNEPPVNSQMQKIFALIRSKTGHDFSHYKSSTIARRIERRLAIQQVKTLPDYILYLQKNPAEIDVLFKNLVIGVTSFFRDPQAFDILSQQVLPAMLERQEPNSTIRFWVAGCSTGEEAYSLGICLCEALDKTTHQLDIQIFATDIDATALDSARKGVYPDSIAADVSSQRLNRFFDRKTGFFKINKQLRDMVVFSLHNLIKDPPFSRLDLVSCRNLMIYLDNTLQRKILPLFHYTLKPNGILLLGTSESIGDHTDVFKPIDAKWKIFERQKGRTDTIPTRFSEIDYPARPNGEPDEKDDTSQARTIQAMVEREILDQFTPPGVVVDHKFRIFHFSGKTDRYLTLPTGKPIFNILDMARKDLKPALAATLYKAARENSNGYCKDIRITDNGGTSIVDLSVKQISPGLMLVVFEDKTPKEKADQNKPAALKTQRPESDLQILEHELQSTREYLQATIEELETSNEELKSTNEELQSVNEELQSTNEELETSKEELQSTNEELATVNEELQSRLDEFTKANDDMNNLLASTEIASLFLDTELRIQRFTPSAANIINLIQTDVGRPLNDLKTRFPNVDFVDLAAKVLKDLNTVEVEILSLDEIWHAVKIVPYRTTKNVISGVVMTFINIHKVKKADTIRRLAAILEDANDAITVLDLKGQILSWNKGAQQLYGWKESEALQMKFSDLAPKDRCADLEEIIHKLAKGEAVKSFKSQRKTKDGSMVDIWLTASALTDENGRLAEIAITERNLAWLAKE